jgi:hypothetical protein
MTERNEIELPTESVTLEEVLLGADPTEAPSTLPSNSEDASASVVDVPLDALDPTNATLFVEQAMATFKIEVRYDGSLVQEGMLQRADTRATVDEVLAADELIEADVLDQLILIKHNHDYTLIKAEALKAAFRRYCRLQQNLRRKQVMAPLLRIATQEEQAMADAEWRKLELLFEADTALPRWVIAHFMWQVKQKVLGRPVVHHLMPIVYSSIQGSGKTTFVRKLLDPLQELASADTLLSDFADKKSGSIYRYLVVTVDDMELLPKAAVPALKSLITSHRINRRKVHTNQNMSIRQRATLIGTANAIVQELINDGTGHRRFATLSFRNGDSAKGGDPAIWDLVSELDYRLLWLSVDAFGPSPIAPYLRELHEFQNQGRPVPPLLTWLREVDVESSTIKSITTRWGVLSDPLRNLFMTQTGIMISRQKFKEEMMTHLSDDKVPFAEWRGLEVGKVYTLKARRSPPPAASSDGDKVPPAPPVSSASSASSASH